MAEIPLEDGYEDIVAKAMRGLGRTVDDLAAALGWPAQDVRQALEAAPPAEKLAELARELGLGARALGEIAAGTWRPHVPPIAGHMLINSREPEEARPGESVNAYLVWDLATRQAALVDAGVRPEVVSRQVTLNGLRLHHVFVTHTHVDHVEHLPSMGARMGPLKALAHPREAQTGMEPMRPGSRLNLGSLEVEALETAGHSPGGMTFVVRGLQRPVAFVGDALFAGSIGKMSEGVYAEGLKQIRERILRLPPETILCPGHGPVTTVFEELRHNPFFATR